MSYCGLEPLGSCRPCAECFFLLFSSWVIASAPIRTGKCSEEKTYNQRSTLGKTIWNALWDFWHVFCESWHWCRSSPRIYSGQFASAQPSFLIFALKSPKQKLICFLTEILRGNQRQFYFGIRCCLVPHCKACSGDLGQLLVWAAAELVTCHLSLLRSPSGSRVATVRGQAGSGHGVAPSWRQQEGTRAGGPLCSVLPAWGHQLPGNVVALPRALLEALAVLCCCLSS